MHAAAGAHGAIRLENGFALLFLRHETRDLGFLRLDLRTRQFGDLAFRHRAQAAISRRRRAISSR